MKWPWIGCCTTLLLLAGCAPMRDIDLTPDHPAHPQATEAPPIVRADVLQPDSELVQPVPPVPRAVDREPPHDHPQPDDHQPHHEHRERQHEHHPPTAPPEPHQHPQQQDEPHPHQHGAARGAVAKSGGSPIRPGEDPQ